jgi:four helix bundle protein
MDGEREVWFDHEKLKVYQDAIGFIGWLWETMEGRGWAGEIKDQLDRESTSMPLNIAEGNGKYSAKERARFFETALASALECAAGLDVLVARRKVARTDIAAGKAKLSEIVRMLVGLIKRNGGRENGGSAKSG